MELQKSVTELRVSVDGLKSDVKDVKSKLDSVRIRIAYFTGAVAVMAVVVSGAMWVVSRIVERAWSTPSNQAQTQIVSPPSPANNPARR
jgi:hypothetical protein